MRPIMVGLHRAFMIKHICIAGAISCTSAVLMYFCYNRPRINKFKKFYCDFDAEKCFDRMCQKWVLDCCPEPKKEEEPPPKPKSRPWG